MAKVILANNWFAPNRGGFGGQRFRKNPDGDPVDIPNRLLKYLPKSAKVVGEDYVAPHVLAAKEQEAKDLDAFRAMDDDVTKVLEKAGVLDTNYNPFVGKDAPEDDAEDPAEEAKISQRAQDADAARKKRAEFRKAQEAERNASNKD
jgi:hypothetical protein